MRSWVSLLVWFFPLLLSAECPRDNREAAQWVAGLARSLSTEGFARHAISEAAQRLQSCQAEWQKIPAAKTCLEPLQRFTRAQLLSALPGHSLGSELTDQDLLASAPYPEMLELPAPLRELEFLRLLDLNDRASLDLAQKRIEEVNAKIADPAKQWRVFEYVSQHLYTPDDTKTLGRFFVYVPGDDFDRYLQFGLQDDPTHPIPKSVSIVAIRKTDPVTRKSLSIPEARLIDLWRLRETDGNIRFTTRLAMTGELENCYQCHKSAVLPIHPNPSSFDATRYRETVAFVNRQMASYGRVQMAGIDMEAYGPGMGPKTFATRTPEFLKTCAGENVSESRLAAIGNAMRCTRCHDGETRGKLNFLSARYLSPPSTHSLLEDYVVSQRMMPPGADLSEPERKALVRCLKTEYYGTQGVLESWLANSACWN